MIQPVGSGHVRPSKALLGVRLVAVGQVTPMGQVQAHDAVVHVAERGEHLEVRRRSTERLHVHAPPQQLKQRSIAKLRIKGPGGGTTTGRMP